MIFLWELIELKNCDEKEVRDLPRPTMPLAPLAKPFKRGVCEQVKSNGCFVGSGSNSTTLDLESAIRSSTSSPSVAPFPVMLFSGRI